MKKAFNVVKETSNPKEMTTPSITIRSTEAKGCVKYNVNICRSNSFVQRFISTENSIVERKFVAVPNINFEDKSKRIKKTQIAPRSMQEKIEVNVGNSLTKSLRETKEIGPSSSIYVFEFQHLIDAIFCRKFFSKQSEVVKFSLLKFLDGVEKVSVYTFFRKSHLDTTKEITVNVETKIPEDEEDSGQVNIEGSVLKKCALLAHVGLVDDRKEEFRTISKDFFDVLEKINKNEKVFSIKEVLEMPNEIIFLYNLAIRKKYAEIVDLYHSIMTLEKNRPESDFNKAFSLFVNKVTSEYPQVVMHHEISTSSKEFIIKPSKKKVSECHMFGALHFYNQSFNYFQKVIGVSLYCNGVSNDDLVPLKAFGCSVSGVSANSVIKEFDLASNVNFLKFVKNRNKELTYTIYDNFKETVRSAYKKTNINQNTDKMITRLATTKIFGESFDATKVFNSGDEGIATTVKSGVGKRIGDDFEKFDEVLDELSEMQYSNTEIEKKASQYYSQRGSIFLSLDRKDSSKTLDVCDLLNKVYFLFECVDSKLMTIDNVICLDHGMIKQVSEVKDAVEWASKMTDNELLQLGIDLKGRRKEFFEFYKYILKIITPLDVLHCCGASHDGIIFHELLKDVYQKLHEKMSGGPEWPTVEKKLVYFRELIGHMSIGAKLAFAEIEVDPEYDIPETDYFSVLVWLLKYTTPFFYYLPILWVNRTNNIQEVRELIATLIFELKRIGRKNYLVDSILLYTYVDSLYVDKPDMCKVFCQLLKWFNESKLELAHNQINNLQKKNISADRDRINKIIHAVPEYQKLQDYKQEFFGIGNRKAYSFWSVNIREKYVDYSKNLILNKLKLEIQKREKFVEMGFNAFVEKSNKKDYSRKLRIPWSIDILYNRRNREQIENKEFIYNGISLYSLNDFIFPWVEDDNNIQDVLDTNFGRGKKANKLDLLSRRIKVTNHLFKSLEILSPKKVEIRKRIEELLSKPTSNPMYKSNRSGNRIEEIKMNIIEKNILLFLMVPLNDQKEKIPMSIYNEVGNSFAKITGLIKNDANFFLQFRSQNRKNTPREEIIQHMQDCYEDVFLELESEREKIKALIPIKVEEQKRIIRKRNQDKIKSKKDIVTEEKTEDYLGRIGDDLPKVEEVEYLRDDRKRKFGKHALESYHTFEGPQEQQIKLRRKFMEDPVLVNHCAVEGCEFFDDNLKYKTTSLKSGILKVKESHKKIPKAYVCGKCYKRDLCLRKKKE